MGTRIVALSCALMIAMSVGPGGSLDARADVDPALEVCRAAAWNMDREIGLFAGVPARAMAGEAIQDAPVLEVGRLYALQLVPQVRVQFAQHPGKDERADNSSAGLARLAVTADGTYRVTVDLPAWIDVVSGAGLVGSSSFRGWHECRVFKKSVEFALPARESLILQVSGARADAVKLVVTHVESEL